jgi:hypothetical protein
MHQPYQRTFLFAALVACAQTLLIAAPKINVPTLPTNSREGRAFHEHSHACTNIYLRGDTNIHAPKAQTFTHTSNEHLLA